MDPARLVGRVIGLDAAQAALMAMSLPVAFSGAEEGQPGSGTVEREVAVGQARGRAISDPS